MLFADLLSLHLATLLMLFILVSIYHASTLHIESTDSRIYIAVITRARIAKLSASHVGINSCPSIVTHSSPVSIQTHLHSTIQTSRTISQSNAATRTSCGKYTLSNGIDCIMNTIKLMQHTGYTLNSSILRVGTISSVEIMWAVYQSRLIWSTGNVIKCYNDGGI